MPVFHPTIDLTNVSDLQSLRPFAPAANRLLGLLVSENVDFGSVVTVLRDDPSLSSQVLRVVNSAMFGPRQEVSNVLLALSLLGVDRVRDIVVTLALRDYVGYGSHTFLHRCRRHSLATAHWAELLAQHLYAEGPLTYSEFSVRVRKL